MPFRLDEIAAALGARLDGDGSLIIEDAAEPADAGSTSLALAMTPKYAEGLTLGRARAAVLWEGADRRDFGLDAALFVPRPRYAMASITKALDPGPDIAPGIHPSAIVDPTAQIGANAAIGPFVVIGAGVVIGDNARIAPHVTIARNARIGADVLLSSGVSIGAGVVIGARFIAQPNSVIGADGFSFVTPEKSSVEKVRESLGDAEHASTQSWTRIHSIGSVEIGDDVELGANSAIDRGTIRSTRVGRGTKIDNLVQIGHNVQIGEDCLLCGHVGVAGSARIGNRVVLAGQVGVNDNIFIGDDVVAGGGTKIFTNAPAGRVLLGYPALKMDQHIEVTKALRRLPRLMSKVSDLEKAVSKPDQTD